MRISMRASAAAETRHCYFQLYLGDVGFRFLGSWAGLGAEHRKRILRGICLKSPTVLFMTLVKNSS